jgi:hypothetical protein
VHRPSNPNPIPIGINIEGSILFVVDKLLSAFKFPMLTAVFLYVVQLIV